MDNKSRLTLIAYFLVLAVGTAHRLVVPHEVKADEWWMLFVAPPPPPSESQIVSFAKGASGSSDIILEVVGDMVLAHVNKINALPAEYVPPGIAKITGVPTSGAEYLRAAVLPYLYQLYGAAKLSGHNLSIVSAYRSYSTQVATFSYWASQYGYSAAVMGSARPGHSEHQLGTVVDLGLAGKEWPTGFSWDPAADWTAKNAHKFGFVVSYPPGKTAITGYIHEPWHIRWVGIELATKLYQQNLSLEEYLSSL